MKPEQLRKIDKLVAETRWPETNWLALCPKCGHDWVFSSRCCTCKQTRARCGRCDFAPVEYAECVHRYTTDPAASDTIVDWLETHSQHISLHGWTGWDADGTAQIGVPMKWHCRIKTAKGRFVTGYQDTRHLALALAFLESQGVEVPEW